MSSIQIFNNDDELSYNDMQFDEHDFEIFFKKYFIQLCAFCQFKFGFDLDQAKDIVQTAFVKLWETRETISADLAVKSYLFKIIHNHILDTIKHDKVKQKYLRTFHEGNPDASYGSEIEDIDFKQLTADIESSVSKLPGQMRKIFELSRYEGLKYKDIAQQLNISVKTVETQISRALVKLRQELGQYLSIFIITGLICAVLKKYFT